MAAIPLAAATLIRQPFGVAALAFFNLRQLYFRAILSDPMAALEIYVSKLWDSLVAISDFSTRALTRGFLLFAVLASAWLVLRGWRRYDEAVMVVASWRW